MTRHLRRDIRLFQAYATISSLVLVFVAVSAFRQAPVPQKLDELIDKLNAAQQIADAALRDQAIKQARASMPPSPRRVFVGKETDRSAAIMLADAEGHPRLRLRVEAAGQASIEFLDRDGKVTERIPAR